MIRRKAADGYIESNDNSRAIGGAITPSALGNRIGDIGRWCCHCRKATTTIGRHGIARNILKTTDVYGVGGAIGEIAVRNGEYCIAGRPGTTCK